MPSIASFSLHKNGLGHNLREKEVGRTGRGIRLHIFIAGDHFANAIPVQCTFGDISVSFLLCKHSGSKRANCRDGLVWRIYIVHGPLVMYNCSSSKSLSFVT